MVVYVEYIIYFFLLFFYILLLYSLVSLFIKKNESKFSLKREKVLISLIKEYSNEDNENRKLFKKLKRKSYLYSLEGLLKNNKIIREVINNTIFEKLFIKLTLYYQKKDLLSKTYYASILKYVCFKHDIILTFLNELLVSSSIYSTENALLVLYNLGDINQICHAYRMISKKNILYNHKLISDGLLEYKGNRNNLCNKLYDSFDDFNVETKIGIVTYFRNSQFDIKEKLYERLLGNNEKEVEISIIRYFTKIYYEKANNLFEERLFNNYYNDFEYNVVMIQALGNTNELSKRTIDILNNCLNDNNYYIRYNAAQVLCKKTKMDNINIKDDNIKNLLEYVSQEG